MSGGGNYGPKRMKAKKARKNRKHKPKNYGPNRRKVQKARKNKDMKKILITGAGSFIGTSFEKYIKNHQKAAEYEISVMDTLTGKIVPGPGEEASNKSEKEWDFTGYDVVFHVAGIAHADVGKVSE